MMLQNEREFANTTVKLQRLQERYEALQNDEREDAHVRELTLRSLKSTINQLREDIARYRAAHIPAQSR